ncbi:MAG: 2Fe-2S iron-sulfur cluster-binding protein [Gemmatimonadota bacterium]|nr:2Fe-2S iron-sulfur cluster-binding protein [Gemmatimonadota bacterium]
MVSLSIDGRKVEVEEGTYVLEAARAAGIHIPTLCHHESLSPYGACRFCMVEVTQRSRTRLYTSCTLPVAEGMEVATGTEKVIKIRRILAELMLARCPHSDPVIEIARELGVTKTRFGSPRASESCLVGEHGECILCGMCVRLCDDVLKVGALAFEGRGGYRTVTTPFREPSEVCRSCGACESICPTGSIMQGKITDQAVEKIPFEFEQGLANRKPIYLQFPQAVPRVPVIDPETCMYFKTEGCKVCEDNCEAEAIDHSKEDEIKEVTVGAIILATGFEVFDGRQIPRYGYGRLTNVLSALEFERICHASGPTGGKIVTASGETPKSVGIVHCVGSRDRNYQEYCSRVCCMYSLKFAHLVREKTGAEVTNFYIDMRAFGKGYEEFYNRLMSEDVNFVRGKVAEVTDSVQSPGEEGKLVVVVEDTLLGVVRRVPVDMVVLSAGLKPGADTEKLNQTFSLCNSVDGFFAEKHPKLAPVDTASDGIFLAGACQGAKDIPDSVAQGAAAAAGALSLIDRGSIVLEPVRAKINDDLCGGCQICVANCPFTAVEYDPEKGVSVVYEELCKGCGTCVAGCPTGAAQQDGYEDRQIISEIEGVLS